MTIQEVTPRKEDLTFDPKSIQIDLKALAIPIVAFANAICPPQAVPITCSNGKRRGLTEDKYLNRISFVLFAKIISLTSDNMHL